LQRQFFEAIVRACYVNYSNNAELSTLSQKLDDMFKSKLNTLAGRNKAKTAEEEKNFKIAEKAFVEFDNELRTVFKYFSKKQKNQNSANALFLQEDITLDLSELINLFSKAKLIGSKQNYLLTEDLIQIVERYYAPDKTLAAKLNEAKFQEYARKNPMLLKVNQEIEARKQRVAQR